MATKFETKSAITRLIYEISSRSLRITGGFGGRAIERCQTNSTTTNHSCHGNEFWHKIGYDSACQSNFTTTDPGCHGNEIWDKTGYNSAHIENIAVPLAPIVGSFVGGQLNDVRQILPRSTSLPWQHNLRQKSPITRLVLDISPRCLRLTGGSQGQAIQWCQ